MTQYLLDKTLIMDEDTLYDLSLKIEPRLPAWVRAVCGLWEPAEPGPPKGQNAHVISSIKRKLEGEFSEQLGNRMRFGLRRQISMHAVSWTCLRALQEKGEYKNEKCTCKVVRQLVFEGKERLHCMKVLRKLHVIVWCTWHHTSWGSLRVQDRVRERS